MVGWKSSVVVGFEELVDELAHCGTIRSEEVVDLDEHCRGDHDSRRRGQSARAGGPAGAAVRSPGGGRLASRSSTSCSTARFIVPAVRRRSTKSSARCLSFPGVVSVGAGQRLPLRGGGYRAGLRIDERPDIQNAARWSGTPEETAVA
jgi:hypothetical protein